MTGIDSAAEAEPMPKDWRVVLDAMIDDLIDISPVRDDDLGRLDWFKAICNECGEWFVKGKRDDVQEGVVEHVSSTHLDFDDPHLVGSGGRAGVVSYPAVGRAVDGPHAAVSVCGLESCVSSASSWVRVMTGRDGVFRLDPTPVDPDQGTLFEPSAPPEATDPAPTVPWLGLVSGSDEDMYRAVALLVVATEDVHPDDVPVPVSVRAAEVLRARDRDRARIRELEAELSRTVDKLALARRQLETVRESVGRVLHSTSDAIAFGIAQDVRDAEAAERAKGARS